MFNVRSREKDSSITFRSISDKCNFVYTILWALSCSIGWTAYMSFLLPILTKLITKIINKYMHLKHI